MLNTKLIFVDGISGSGKSTTAHYLARPDGLIKDQILKIVQDLTPYWFTENVLHDTANDLLFQDVVYLVENDKIISFIIFTCWDGSIYITLMGTDPGYKNHGYGTILINSFFERVKSLGFNKIKLLTVPAETKPHYAQTIKFYEKNGFFATKRFNEIWESGALLLEKEI